MKCSLSEQEITVCASLSPLAKPPPFAFPFLSEWLEAGGAVKSCEHKQLLQASVTSAEPQISQDGKISLSTLSFKAQENWGQK